MEMQPIVDWSYFRELGEGLVEIYCDRCKATHSAKGYRRLEREAREAGWRQSAYGDNYCPSCAPFVAAYW